MLSKVAEKSWCYPLVFQRVKWSTSGAGTAQLTLPIKSCKYSSTLNVKNTEGGLTESIHFPVDICN